MNYSVCIDNLNLVAVNSVSIDWTTPFINLFFDREKARAAHFADNGKHWQYNDTDYSFRTTNLNVYLDDHDHITGLSMYKYKSTSFNHGKNSSSELKVAVSDIKKSIEILSGVVTDHSDEELEKLIAYLSESEFGIERNLSVRKNDIVLLDLDGQIQSIKQKALLKAIRISHTYLEIFHDDTVFDLSPKEFTPEIRPVLHEVLSFVNPEGYYRFTALKEEMERRQLVATADEKYPKLRQAVIAGDLNSVNQLAEYSKLVPQENPKGSPLYHAVKGNWFDIAKVLLENGAYTIETDKEGSNLPIEVAYKNGNQDMVRLLTEYHGAHDKTFSVTRHNIDKLLKLCAENKDYETLELIAPEAFINEAGIWMQPNMFLDMNDDELRTISQYPGIRIAWGLDAIQPIYEKKDLDLCCRLLQQGSTKQVVEYFIAINDFDLFQASLARHTALDTKGAYEPVFDRDKEWYDSLCEHTTKKVLPNGRVRYGIEDLRDSYYVKWLDNAEFDRFIRSIKTLEVTAFTFSLGNYHTIYYPEKCTDPEAYRKFANYMLVHYDFHERYSFLEDIVKYFGDEVLTRKYNQKCPLLKDYNSASVDAFWQEFAGYQLRPKYIENKYATMIAGAEIIRSSFGIEPFEDKGKVAVLLAGSIIGVCCGDQPPLSGEEEREKRRLRAVNCMKALLEKMDLKELDAAVKKMYGASKIENTKEWFEYQKVNYQPMLDLVEG